MQSEQWMVWKVYRIEKLNAIDAIKDVNKDVTKIHIDRKLISLAHKYQISRLFEGRKRQEDGRRT